MTNVLENPDASTFAVEDVMVSDAPMTTRILRVANTNFYRGSREKVTDANEAIGTLGFEKIRNVALTTSVFKMFSGPSAADKFSLEGLWKHCLGVASASTDYCKYLGKSWHETAYTCGLVHDIGKVARFKLDEDDETEVFIKDSQTSLDKKISLIQQNSLINPLVTTIWVILFVKIGDYRSMLKESFVGTTNQTLKTDKESAPGIQMN